MPSRERIERMKKEIRAERESEKQAIKEFLRDDPEDEWIIQEPEGEE